MHKQKNETTKIDTSENIKAVNPPVQIAETPVIVETKPATVADSTAINKPQAIVPVAVQNPDKTRPGNWTKRNGTKQW